MTAMLPPALTALNVTDHSQEREGSDDTERRGASGAVAAGSDELPAVEQAAILLCKVPPAIGVEDRVALLTTRVKVLMLGTMMVEPGATLGIVMPLRWRIKVPFHSTGTAPSVLTPAPRPRTGYPQRCT